MASAGWLSAALVLLRVATALIPTGQILLLAEFLDSAREAFSTGQFTAALVVRTAYLVGLQFLNYLLSTASAWLSARHRVRVGTAFEMALQEKRSRLAYSLLEDSDVCDLTSQVLDGAGEKTHLGFMNLLSLGEYILRILGICVTIFASNALVGIAALIMFAVLIPIVKKGGEEDYDSSARAVTQFRRAAWFRREICGQEHSAERRTFSATAVLNEKWVSYFDTARRISKKGSAKELFRLKLVTIVTLVFSCGLAALLTVPLGSGDMGVSIYISLVAATANLVQMISWYAAFLIEDFVEYRKRSVDISRFLALEEVAPDGPKADVPLSVERVEFRHVSFRYPKMERWILHDLSFTMERGKCYALVGENGAGKSTVVKLLLGLYTDYQGQILIDGRELRTFSPGALREMFACAWQDFGKYEITVEENLLFGRESSRQEAEELTHKLGLEDLGLGTDLGRLEETGRDLSGGQWQRIAIARTLLRHAPVTIADEPAAALDPSGEVDVYNILRQHTGDGIELLITHRLGCIREADEILLLSNGSLAERGTHGALLSRKGIYAEMYETQRSWYL